LISSSSFVDLLILIPPLVIGYNAGVFGLFFLSVSRLLRVTKAASILRSVVVIGDTDVSRKIVSIILMVFILIYISAGVFMVIENFNEDKP